VEGGVLGEKGRREGGDMECGGGIQCLEEVKKDVGGGRGRGGRLWVGGGWGGNGSLSEWEVMRNGGGEERASKEGRYREWE